MPVIDTAVKTSKPGDYVDAETGLLTCSVCHKGKQVRLELYGQASVMSCLCDCERAALEAEEEKRQARQRAAKVAGLRKAGLQDELLAGCTFANDDGTNPQMPKARAYIEAWELMYAQGFGMLVYGPVGTGKSFFAGCIANELVNRGVSVLVTNIPRVLNDLADTRLSGRGAYLSKLDSFDLLVIDDLGVERTSDYGFEQVFSVIDGRYRTGRPLIVTTNIPLKAMKDEAAPIEKRRIYDRILERCAPVCMNGKNYRKQKAAANLATMQRLLADTGCIE
ncbi:ATP-binding protein [Gordonibacter sp.]|uniref:ATP-binding protein n=1 Tax=Gordonibacter sp. TaxID=1968902 RepID=UPI002FCB36F7